MPEENRTVIRAVSDVLNPGVSPSFLENRFISVARTLIKMKMSTNSAFCLLCL